MSRQTTNTTAQIAHPIPDDILKEARQSTLEVLQGHRDHGPAVLKPLFEVLIAWHCKRRTARQLWIEAEVVPNHHHVTFKALVEMSLHAFRGYLHCEVALKLLVRPEIAQVKIITIACAVGFTKIGQLDARIQARHGMTAEEYRQKYTPKALIPANAKPVSVVPFGSDLRADDMPATPWKMASGLLQQGRRAYATDLDRSVGLYDDALVVVHDNQLVGLTDKIQAFKGLSLLARWPMRAEIGQYDGAWADWHDGEVCHDSVKVMPPEVPRRLRLMPPVVKPRIELVHQFCGTCRPTLMSDVGKTARYYLDNALSMVPRDLDWFEVCCDGCYRLYWEPIDMARFILDNNAWRAWWLGTMADADDRRTPPTVARFIAALVASEKLKTGDQAVRLRYCQYALEDAEAIGNPLLIAIAHIYLGNSLRTTAQDAADYEAAAQSFAMAEHVYHGSPWIDALRYQMVTNLAIDRSRYIEAKNNADNAIEGYDNLDRHSVGIGQMKQGEIAGQLGHSEEAIAAFLRAEATLDERRGPLLKRAILPLNLTTEYGKLGQIDKAATSLASCAYDRVAHPLLAALELFDKGSLAVATSRPTEALACFSGSLSEYRRLNHPLNAALVTTYSVEPLVYLREYTAATSCVADAYKFFSEAGLADTVEEALRSLRQLIEVAVVDSRAVARSVRQLGRQHGGWVPELP
jgi:tetratricopeptide (TPR) repeat protein